MSITASVVGRCKFPDCEKPLHGRTYCDGHYRQKLRGAPLRPLSRTSLSVPERFWQKVRKSSPRECWEWAGHKNADGYGNFWAGGSMQKAHRVSFELTNGPIADGLEIDHICHNRSCMNPRHLREVSHGQNGQNLRGAYRSSSSGIRGVYWKKGNGKWAAHSRLSGKAHHIGYFDTAEEAEDAVTRWRRQNMPYSIKDQAPDRGLFSAQIQKEVA